VGPVGLATVMTGAICPGEVDGRGTWGHAPVALPGSVVAASDR
jgi:hypothetical protein